MPTTSVCKNRRVNDGGVWNKRGLAKALEEGTVNLPLPCCLPGGNKEMPYILVGDDAFALKPYLMKPYAQQGLDAEKRVYNYMHNRARRILENLFGILANRWRFMRNLLHPDVIEGLVSAALVPHNFLRGEVLTELWRQDLSFSAMEPLETPTRGHNSSVDTKHVRDLFKDYFSHEGALEWQWESC